ncbi:MAG: 4Fe-4S cluster-binding domain-containing protein [Candidatus Lokiarchaeota archaeon]|nr:4Fe-4S cluster-binding domain-containing protein [Candidatus Lokiarchaeota archaeon]
MQLRINSIDYSNSIVDGPGVRTVLYIQGCDQRCEGCHNPSTWDKGGGIARCVDDVAAELVERCKNKKLTISGGEPILQADAVVELLRLLPGFDVALYTGLELDAVPGQILVNLHYIKVGRYIARERTTTEAYIGSKNQRFIDLTRGQQ